MEHQGSIVVFPGTFDPLTNGHLSLIRRGCEVFDQVVVAVAADTSKITMFNLEERVELVKASLVSLPKARVDKFSGLLVNYVSSLGCRMILRGLRAFSDFEYEFQLALMNRKLARDIQTAFFITDYQWLFTSSTMVKQTASLGGEVSSLVPEPVHRALLKRFGRSQ